MNAMNGLNNATYHGYLFGIGELLIQSWDVKKDSDIIIIKSNLTQDIIFGYLWWLFIAIISIYNCYTIIHYWRKWLNTKLSLFQKQMLYLSSIYVIVCAIRAIWPRKDVDRICFFDQSINTVIVGRSIATIAELCFVKQLSLVLGQVINKYNFGINPKSFIFTSFYAYYVPFIFIAECCSWTGVATKCQIWNAIEESIWMITGLHMTISYLLIYLQENIPNKDRRQLAIFICAGLGFVIFMCFIDIPMYVERWYIDTYIDNIQYLPLSEGIIDLMECKQIIHDFSIWWEDIPWMTGYFSVGVWISISFINIPIIDHAKQQIMESGKKKMK